MFRKEKARYDFFIPSDTDGISSIITPSTNLSLISPKTSWRQQNKHLIRKPMSMSMRFCSAISQLLHRSTSALQANKRQRSMKLEIMSRDGINTNSSWEHNSHSHPMRSHHTQTNTRKTSPPETTPTNSEKKRWYMLPLQKERSQICLTTQPIRSLWNSAHNAHRPNPQKRNQVITLNWFVGFVDMPSTQPSRVVQTQKHKHQFLPKYLVPTPKSR